MIRIDPAELPRDAWRMICEALTFVNHDKKVALREKLWDADKLPDSFKLYRDNGTLPRGFARQLSQGASALGIDLTWDDRRTEVPIDTSSWNITPFVNDRHYQEIAVCEILREQQGMWQAPPGAGKTVAVLEAIRRSKQRALVIVNKSNLVYQWISRAETFLGVTPGIVGDGEFEVKDITIALQQTLWSRSGDFDDSRWWDQFGFVCLDECHHLAARTYVETMSSFSARYRIGVSGTPDQQINSMPMMEATLGPVFHVTERQQLVDAGVLVNPVVRINKTDFEYPYYGTHENTRKKPCEVEDCAGSPNVRVHRNNYTKMVEELARDSDRNRMIAGHIYGSLANGRTTLVVSKRLQHLRDLRNKVLWMLGTGDDPRLIMLTGAQSGEERTKIAELADSGGVVLFSTIADEALDIPRLDTIVLPWPAANPKITQQQVGRIVRVHATKNTPIVYDYADWRVDVLRRQYYKRLKLYRQHNFDVHGLDND